MKKLNIKTGDKFTANIEGKYCEGLITIQGDRIYLCQNSHQGSIADNLNGYRYSWAIRNSPDFVTKNIMGEYTVHIKNTLSVSNLVVYIKDRSSRIEALYKEV